MLKRFLARFSYINTTAKVFLLQNLCVMIKAGVPLANGLQTLTEQTPNVKLKEILVVVTKKVKQGQSFATSLKPYRKQFGEMFINMIEAGEAGGQLQEVLEQLHVQTKKDHQLKAKVRNALTYPVIIILAMIAIGAFVLIFVLPSITDLFRDLDIELPLATKMLIAINDFIQSNGLLVAGIFLATLIILIQFLRSKIGHVFLSRAFLKLPVFSPIVKKVNLARIARSLSSLIKTDIAIIQSLQITSKVIGNTVYKQVLLEVAEQVRRGGQIATSLKKYPQIFPASVTQIISVGEDTGSLDEIMDNLAGFYEEEVTETMNSLPSIIEPILMILIGLGVAGIALAILTPIYSLTQNF